MGDPLLLLPSFLSAIAAAATDDDALRAYRDAWSAPS